MIWRRALIVMLMVPVGLLPADVGDASDEASPATPGRSGVTWDDYRIVIDRNIFSRNRRPRPVAPTPQAADDAQPTGVELVEQAYFVLVGVSIIGDRPTAFLEDRRTGAMHTVHEGDTLADRRIAAITVDRLTVTPTDDEADSKLTVIELGRALTGQIPALSTRSGQSMLGATDRGPSSPSASAGPEADSPAVQSILERLRQQRRQELEP